MANLFDYLQWRGDVPFQADPFNEVDNLVLCELAYTDFDGIVPPDGPGVPLASAYEQYFALHSREEVMGRTSYTGKAPLLMEEMVRGARFGGTRVCRYINEVDKEKDCQVSAVTFLLADGTAFVAFRGTDGTLVGWKEDFDLSYADRTEGQRRAVDYLNAAAAAVPGPLRVGGHSKGGHFAVYAAAYCDPRTQDRIQQVYSNDGPGFRPDILAAAGYQRIVERVISIVPDTSVIGMLLETQAAHRVVKSSASGIVQHDGFSWQILRNRFVPAKLSETSVFLDQVLDTWLAGMDDDTRRSMTDTVFSVLSSAGEDTFHAMSEQKLKTAEAILSAVQKLPREKQREMRRLAAQLLQSGGMAAAAYLPGNQGEKKPAEKE